MEKKTEIVKADSVDQAKRICKWATMFQRTEDWKTTNNWICSVFI